MNFEEVVVYSMSICIVGDFYTIVVVVKVCMLIVNNCKSYVIEKFCIVCYNYKDNYCEHADLNGDGDVDGDGDDDEDNSTNHFSYSDGNDNHKRVLMVMMMMLMMMIKTIIIIIIIITIIIIIIIISRLS